MKQPIQPHQKEKNLNLLLSTYILALFCQFVTPAVAQDFSQYVNPFIGTGGTGHTFPGATVPFGLVQLSPNTGNFDWDYHAGYQFRDTTLRGFAHTHLSGGGNPALGNLLMQPFADGEFLDNESVAFAKSEEKASPGYYTTYLTKDEITVELSATPRTGIHRYTFHQAGRFQVFINLDEMLYRGDPAKSVVRNAAFNIEDERSVSGYTEARIKGIEQKCFFTIEFSKPFLSHRFLDKDESRKLLVDYQMNANEPLEVRVAISTVNTEGAKKNLLAESRGRSFEEIRIAAQDQWNSLLSKITIEGTDKQKELFYTSLYHLFIQPNNIADVDGQYCGADDQIHTAPGGEMYSTFAFWDTYRAANSLYTILVPEKVELFVSSILRHFTETGFLPVWTLWGRDSKTMIANHSVPVIVDAYRKGLLEGNESKAFEAIKRTLTTSGWHKNNWEIYDQYGYFPADTVPGESVSRTLESVYDDWAAAQMASALDRSEDDEFFSRRASFYRNVFDSTTRFMRGRNRDGSWVSPFNPLIVSPYRTGLYTEANAWQYLWHVQHDIDGLIKLMGGPEIFAARLDTLFSLEPKKIAAGKALDVTGLIGQYAHGNEPSQHIAYLYNYAGKPYKTQELVSHIVTSMYDNTPEGYSGNNDFGQMSAWYIFSSLGFYPVNPVSGMFDIGTPAHEYASIKLDGRPLVIEANNFSPQNKYVHSIKLNGKPLTNFQISYEQIMQGGELVFEMIDSPH